MVKFVLDKTENFVGKEENAGYQHLLLFSLNVFKRLFSSPEHGVLTVRRCLSICPSVHNLLVNTLASTNINQSSPNLVKMYMTTRARMSSIMKLIRPELSELPALELENLLYLTMFTL